MKNDELENDQNNINQEEENEEEDNIKVFNGLISKDKKQITEKENQTESTNQNSNNNQNSKKKTIKKNFEDFFSNNNSNIDLNLISFGELHSFNNFHNNSNNITSDINKNNNNNNIITKNILQDKIDEQIDENRSINIPEEKLEINNYKNKNNEKTPIIVKENESKNYFRISSIEQGNALLVTGDDTIFTFPAYLLPKGAKLGETFTFEIKAINSSKNNNNTDFSKECIEIDKIQKKYIKENQDE